MDVFSFPVCFSACLLSGCGCLLYKQFWICDLSVSVLSVVFNFEHGISESNKDLKFECRALIISDIIRPNGQQ